MIEEKKSFIWWWKIIMSTFQKWSRDNDLKYPIDQEQIDSLSDNDLVEVFTLDDDRVDITAEWLEANKWPQQGTAEFEREMTVVAQAVKMAKEKVYFDSDDVEDRSRFQIAWLDKSQPYISDVLSKYNVETCDELAELVHNDRPSQILDDAIEWLDKRWAKRREWLIQKSKFWKQFTQTTVFYDALVACLVCNTSYSAFASKWYFWFPRPEEVFWEIAEWTYEYEVDMRTMDVVATYCDLEELKTDRRLFTTYPEWSPTHWSRYAMHSAVASIAFVLNILYDLTDYEKDQLLRLQSNVAFGRTFAWVHRPYDNIGGINLWIRVASNTNILEEIFDVCRVKYDKWLLWRLKKAEFFQVWYSF